MKFPKFNIRIVEDDQSFDEMQDLPTLDLEEEVTEVSEHTNVIFRARLETRDGRPRLRVEPLVRIRGIEPDGSNIKKQ